MKMIFSSLLNAGRVAAMSLAFGVAALAVAPAMAAGPIVNFSLSLPGVDIYSGPGDRHFHHPRRACLSDSDVARELSRAGWRHVRIGDDLGRFRVLAYATWHFDRTLYQMVVDRCSGDVNRIVPVRGGGPRFHGGPGY